MIPILFINCRLVPFVQFIMNRTKIYETRSRNTLRSLVGKRVLIAMTGKGHSVVMCSAIISNAFPVSSLHEWDMFRSCTCVPKGSQYDWTEKTKVKWLYELSDVCPVPFPFHPSEGIRHGRTWMEAKI